MLLIGFGIGYCIYSHRYQEIIIFLVVGMETLKPKDQKILRDYLSGEKSFRDFSEEMGIDYQSAVKKIERIKHKLIERVEPRLRRGA